MPPDSAQDEMTYRLLLEYDGTEFFGWQIQVGYRTVQGELESALERLMGVPVRVTAAGRTDTGVHALGQVVHFSCVKTRSLTVIVKALNGTLPQDLRILKAEVAPPGFHARYSAKWRRYRYRFLRRLSALERYRAWCPPFEVDWDLAIQESSDLLGVHDFTAFSKAGSDSDNPTCNLQAVSWRRDETGVSVMMQADRFLHHMVRSIIGTLVDIGRGRFEPGTVRRLLESKDRTGCGVTAPAHGLYLVEVGY
jgi:tRNA pseudouridine38-40 synthase